MQNTNQKGGAISGGAATAESLMSSRSVLHTTRSGNTRGLQQFYTAPLAAQLIKDVCNPLGKLRAFDPTAGDGSLLFPHPYRFGAEIDRDQIRAARYIEIDSAHPLHDAAKQQVRDQMKADLDKGIEPDMKRLNGPFHINQSYEALQGDIQYLYPLMRLIGLQFSCIVANPPFGLTFEHVSSLNDGKPASSTRIVWLMCLELLMRGGQGAFITGTARLDDEILSDANALRAIYYVLDFGPGELFPGVDLPTSIAFYADPKYRRPTPGTISTDSAHWHHHRIDATLTQDLKALSARIREAMDIKFGPYDIRSSDNYDGYSGESGLTKAQFTDVQREYNRRLEHREKQRGAYDLEVRGNKIRAALSPLAINAIDQNKAMSIAGTARFLNDLNNQRVNYFSLNTRDWKRVKDLADQGYITVSPGLLGAVQSMVEESARLSCPVYPIEPQQRLGYLDDLDLIKCIKDDPDRKFRAGESYKLSVDTQILTNHSTRTERDPKTNELVTNEYRRDRKVLKIEITVPRGDGEYYDRVQKFSETTEDIEYLLDHFELPDPGDVSTRFPELIDYYKEAIAEAMEANALPGIRCKNYQIDDVARLLFKNGGLLAWEQGLGKCALPNTLIACNNTLMRIEDAWDKFADKSRTPDGYGGESAMAINFADGSPLSVDSIGPDGKMRVSQVSELYRQRISETVRRVTLDDGSSIEITKAHKLYTGTEWTNHISAGDTICVPSRLSHGADKLDKDMITMFAWQLAEGYEHGSSFNITQKDAAVLQSVELCAKRLAVKHGFEFTTLHINGNRATHRCDDLYGSGTGYRRFAMDCGFPWGTRSAERLIPDTLMRGDKDSARLLLQILFEAEGCANPSHTEITSASKLMIEQVRHLLRRFGVWARLHTKRKCATNGRRIYRDYYTLTIGGPDLRTFAAEIGFISEKKNMRLARSINRAENGNRNGVPAIKRLAYQASEASGVPLKHLGCRGRSFTGNYTRDSAMPIVEKLRKVDHPAALKATDDILRLCNQEVHYAKVVSVEEFHYDGYVYDLTVPGDHNFVASGILAHNTFGSMLWSIALEHLGETDGNALFITPQDLIPQWKREAKKFFGREFVVIRDAKQAREIARGIRNKTLKPAWYITYFEALAVNGVQVRTVNTLDRIYQGNWITETRTVPSKRGRAILEEVPVKFIHRIPGRVGKDGAVEPARAVRHVVSTTREYCPRCYTGEQQGWDGTKCDKCGETLTLALAKPMAHALTTAFKQGAIIVDEGTKIKGDDSLTSLAVRGLRARRKLLMTGTPIKNYVNDCFHLLGWALGWGSTRFPFAYGSEGKSKFEKDFCVIEVKNRRYRKVLPEVTNLSILWKLLSGSIVRRRKEDTGEDLVERTFVPITAPMGTAQRKQYTEWLTRFEQWYMDTHPDADADTVEMMAAALGQLHKLEYASTMPLADEDGGYWNTEGLSNMTPANLKVLETALLHVQQGEKVLIGSDVKVAGKWFADQLRGKGINAIHILDKNEETLSPSKRAGLVQDFIHGDAQVLCASEQSMNLGHNLDCASVVILNGLPWDFATLDQFLARVHRLTSQKPVTVYVVIPEASLSERKWKLLEDKGASSDLALDGHLIEKKQKPISQQQFLDELKSKGLPVTETVDEADTQRAWDAVRFEMQTEPTSTTAPTEEQVNTAMQLLLPLDDGRQIKPRIPRYTTMSLFATEVVVTA